MATRIQRLKSNDLDYLLRNRFVNKWYLLQLQQRYNKETKILGRARNIWFLGTHQTNLDGCPCNLTLFSTWYSKVSETSVQLHHKKAKGVVHALMTLLFSCWTRSEPEPVPNRRGRPDISTASNCGTLELRVSIRTVN